MNNSGSGDSTGTTYNGSAPRTISYNTIGAPSTTGANASGTWSISINGNSASVSTLATLGTGISYNNDRTTKIGNGLAIYGAYVGGANSPWTYDLSAQFIRDSRGFELSASWHTPSAGLKIRTLRDCCDNWSSWATFLTDVNYSSYALPLTGGTLSGPVLLDDNAYFRGSPSHGFRFNNSANTINALIVDNSGNTFAYASHRAPIFYDSNDTAFYADFNTTGTSINIAGQINTTKSNGTLLSINSADNIGYNASSGLGTYIKGTGSTYIYGGGIFLDSGGTQRTIWHSGNAPRASNSNLMYYQGFTLDANTMDTNATGFTYGVNAPYTGPIARFSTNGGYDLWLNAPYGGDGYGFSGSFNNLTGLLDGIKELLNQ
jgi:hypothetical protein